MVVNRKIPSPRMIWAGDAALKGEMRNSYTILIGKPERNRQLESPRHKEKYNVSMDHKEIGWEIEDWIHVAQDRD
jgi:hypothetical protein